MAHAIYALLAPTLTAGYFFTIALELIIRMVVKL